MADLLMVGNQLQLGSTDASLKCVLPYTPENPFHKVDTISTVDFDAT
jgi:hypothetical protein